MKPSGSKKWSQGNIVKSNSDVELTGVLNGLFHQVLLRVLGHFRLDSRLLNDFNVAILVHPSLTTVDHIGEDGSGLLIGLSILLGLIEVLLKLVKLSQLLFDGLLSQRLLCLLISDLSLGSSSLDAGLQHVDTIALGS